MPRATATNTTAETGANVPVLDRCMSNGGWLVATSARCGVMAGRCDRGTSVGGSSVTCGGTELACGSPTLARQSTNSCDHGSGMGTTTPRTAVRSALRPRGTKVSSFTRVLLRVAGSRPCRRRSEEHTSELQSRQYLVCRLLLEKKKEKTYH